VTSRYERGGSRKVSKSARRVSKVRPPRSPQGLARAMFVQADRKRNRQV